MSDPELVVIVGGTGRLGRLLAPLLIEYGRQVHVVARTPAAPALPDIEFLAADVRRPDSLPAVLSGAAVVVSAMHGVAPTAGQSPATVDRDGNVNLIRAARAAGARVVLMSVIGARPDHPMQLFRSKAIAEQQLRSTSDNWTIVRASAFAELYGELLAQTAAKSGIPMVFGRGNNPINFVSVHDVAAAVARAVTDPQLRNQTIEVGGPENLTMNQLADRLTGVDHPPRHIPPAVLRAMSVVAAPFRPAQARLARQALAMDQIDMTFDPTSTLAQHPWLTATRVTPVSGHQTSTP
jgi:uncharacterized protein YbjT (DUF2867 family)